MIRTSCRRRNEAEAKILLRRPETLTQQEKALTEAVPPTSLLLRFSLVSPRNVHA